MKRFGSFVFDVSTFPSKTTFQQLIRVLPWRLPLGGLLEDRGLPSND